MAEMNERLAQFMRAEQLTAAKFAEIVQVQPSSISHLLSGRNKPNFEFVSRMMRMFGELNPDWLINGMGSMYRNEEANGREETQIVTTLSDLEPVADQTKPNNSAGQKVPSTLFSDTFVMPQAVVQPAKSPSQGPVAADFGDLGAAVAGSTPSGGSGVVPGEQNACLVSPAASTSGTGGVRHVVVLFEDQTCVVYQHRTKP